MRRTPKQPLDNPLAKQALANPAARAARDKASRERTRLRVHRERDEREARQRAAADDAFRRMKEQAARVRLPHLGRRARPRPRGRRASSHDAQVAEWHRVLTGDLSAGADMAQIKTSYRQLMRKYHPDMHANNPQRPKAANEMSMRGTTAYNGLVAHFEKK